MFLLRVEHNFGKKILIGFEINFQLSYVYHLNAFTQKKIFLFFIEDNIVLAFVIVLLDIK